MTTANLVIALLLTAGQATDDRGRIEGTVVDGAARQTPLAGIEVVLCLDDGGQPVPVEKTTSDAAGRFVFAELPVGADFVYLPGANRNAVHYPGPRITLDAQKLHAEVKLIAYDTVSAPCPLVVREHDLKVRTQQGVLYVSESLVVVNPSNQTYVGQSVGEMPPVSLRLSIPDDFEKVTFQKEFFGRQFMVLDGRLLTSLPWPPGERKLEFTYVLPVEQRHRLLRRRIDLPTSQLTVRVESNTKCISCTLPAQVSSSGGEMVFASRGKSLPAGYMLELQLGELPVPLMAYAKWVALLVLGGLVAVSLVLLRERRPTHSSGGTPSMSRQRSAATIAPQGQQRRMARSSLRR